MEKEKNVICDFTTGVCGTAETSNGIMEFVDLTEKEDNDEEVEESK